MREEEGERERDVYMFVLILCEIWNWIMLEVMVVDCFFEGMCVDILVGWL